MREYTHLKLREAGEEDVVELRCADYYVSRCQRGAEQPARYELPGWLEWMELEIDNIRSVLRRCLIHADFHAGPSLPAPSAGTGSRAPPPKASGGSMSCSRQDLARRRWVGCPTSSVASWPCCRPIRRPPGHLARAVILARDAGQLRLLAESLAIGSVAANMAGDRTAARRLLDESQVVAEGTDDPRRHARVPPGSSAQRPVRGRSRHGQSLVVRRRASQPRDR